MTVAVLRAHRTWQLEEPLRWGRSLDGNALVLTREDGTMLDPEWLSKEFQQVARIRLHDLRHSYASSALAASVPIEVLSKRLGHTRISITQDVYVTSTSGRTGTPPTWPRRRSWGLAPIHDRANG